MENISKQMNQLYGKPIKVPTKQIKIDQLLKEYQDVALTIQNGGAQTDQVELGKLLKYKYALMDQIKKISNNKGR